MQPYTTFYPLIAVTKLSGVKIAISLFLKSFIFLVIIASILP